VALDALPGKLAAGGLLRVGGKQRTDSTHVIAAVAALNRLELAGESVRSALEALASAHPDWVAQRICVSDWARRYGTPMTAWRSSASQAKQDELAIAYARDGYSLLEAVYGSSSQQGLHCPTRPSWLILTAIGERAATSRRHCVLARQARPNLTLRPAKCRCTPWPVTLMLWIIIVSCRVDSEREAT